MTAISGILFKITCESEIPTALFQDPSVLLTMDLPGVSDAEILNYIKYHKLVRFAVKSVTDQAPWFFFADKIEDIGFYYWIDCKSEDSFKNIEKSSLYQTKYLVIQQKIFAALNWTNHGYQIVDTETDISSWYPTNGRKNFIDYSIYDKGIADTLWK